MLSGIAAEVAARPRRTLVFVALLSLAMGLLAFDVQLRIDFYDLFDDDTEARRLSDEYRETFEVNNDLLVVVVEAADGVDPTDRTFEAIHALTEAAKAVPGVLAVSSVTTAPVVRPPGVGDPLSSVAPAFAADLDSLPIDQRIAFARQGRLGTRQLLSEDGRTALVVAELPPNARSHDEQLGPATELREAVVAEAEAYSDVVSVGFGGIAYTKIDAVEQAVRDMSTLTPLAFLALVFLTWWFNRSWWAVAAIMAGLVAALLCALGVMGLFWDDLTQLTSAFPLLMMGITVATGAHVTHRYGLERNRTEDPALACRRTIEGVAGAAFLCTATNAIGFLSLLVAPVATIREFGLYLAVGAMFTFAAVVTVVPAILMLSDARPMTASRTRRASWADRASESFARFVVRPTNAGVITATGVAVLLAGLWLSADLRVDYSVKGEFADSSETARVNQVLDSELEGTIPVEISLLGPPGTWAEPSNLDRLVAFDRELEREENLHTIGLPGVLEEMGRLGLARPSTADDVRATVSAVASTDAAGAALVGQMLTADYSWTRLAALRPEDGAAGYLEHAARVEALSAQFFGDTDVAVTVTGDPLLSYAGVVDLAREMIGAVMLAVVMIVAALALAFRSLRIGAVVLLPNALPLAVGMATYLQVRDAVDPLPSVILCIVLGIAADDTVHLVRRYRDLVAGAPGAEGLPPAEAVVAAFVELRRAMVSSTVVLVTAFLISSMSVLPPSRTTGLLGAFVLSMALLADLVFGLAGVSLLAAADQRKLSKAVR